MITQGAIALIVFLIWYFTFKHMQKQQSDHLSYVLKEHQLIIRKYEELVKESKKEYQELVRDTKKEHAVVVDKFIAVIKEQMEQNNYVSGILSRLEGKLEQVLKGF